MKKPVFKSKFLPGLSKEEFNELADKELKSYGGRQSRLNKTNDEYRITKMKESIKSSEAHAKTRVENISKTWQCEDRIDSVTKASKKQVKCPHCDKEGALSAMKSWHFDYCKSNPNRKQRDSKYEKRR